MHTSKTFLACGRLLWTAPEVPGGNDSLSLIFRVFRGNIWEALLQAEVTTRQESGRYEGAKQVSGMQRRVERRGK